MKRVLIVDDDRDITEALGELLEDKYEVRLAFDGSEALGILLDEDVDAVVLDLMMPTSGETLMEELKARGIKVPVIFASSAANLKERAQRNGATDFIGKPFELKKLEDKLARILGGGGAGGGPPRDGGPLASKPPEGTDRGANLAFYIRPSAGSAGAGRDATTDAW